MNNAFALNVHDDVLELDLGAHGCNSFFGYLPESKFGAQQAAIWKTRFQFLNYRACFASNHL